MASIRLLPPAFTYATGVLTLSAGGPADTETFVVGSTTYTMDSSLTNSANHIKIGANNTATCDNIVAAINAASGAGTTYGTGTTANAGATAVRSGTTVVFTARAEGPAGNAVATTESMTGAAFGAATLTGGGTSATNGAPSAATDGKAMPHLTDLATLFLDSIAGSGTMTVTCKLWGYCAERAKWYPLGTNATAASKGLINQGNAIGETGTDTIAHCETVTSLQKINRVYLEVTAIGGTATEITALLDCLPCQAVS